MRSNCYLKLYEFTQHFVDLLSMYLRLVAVDGSDGTERGYQGWGLGYAGYLNNNNGWIEACMPLLGELGVVADEPMVGPIVDEIAKPVVEVEEQVVAPVVGMDEDIAMLFGDGD
ncbi:hypothetical protein Tco_1082095 [Tanacetum coccineum]|uniref:Uncharacterized protein n=1 Tax=Tanacetum coccineum TaxID=301880 RepID=A0ABQ5HZI5_9ASTR